MFTTCVCNFFLTLDFFHCKILKIGLLLYTHIVQKIGIMESQTFDPRRIAETLESPAEVEASQENLSAIFDHLSNEDAEDYVPQVSPKILAAASVRGFEILAAVSNNERMSKLEEKAVVTKRNKKIPFSMPNLDSLLRNAPFVTKNKLKPRHLPILEAFLFENMSPTDISIKFRLSRSAVYQILSSPAVTDFVNRREDSLSNEYKSLGHKAVSNLREFLAGSDTELKFKATALYLKRANFTPSEETVHRIQGTGKNGEVLIDFKRNLLKRAGVPNEIIEAEFRNISDDEEDGSS